MSDIIKAMEFINNTIDIENITKVLNMSNTSIDWKIPTISDNILLEWGSSKLFLYIEDIDTGYEIEYNDELALYFIKDYPLSFSTDKTEIELYLSKLSNKLGSGEAFKDDNNHWVIQTGDRGWFRFDNGQYVVGAWGKITPDEIMNKLCSDEVTNLNTKSYRWDDKNPPFIAKKV